MKELVEKTAREKMAALEAEEGCTPNHYYEKGFIEGAEFACRNTGYRDVLDRIAVLNYSIEKDRPNEQFKSGFKSALNLLKRNLLFKLETGIWGEERENFFNNNKNGK